MGPVEKKNLCLQKSGRKVRGRTRTAKMSRTGSVIPRRRVLRPDFSISLFRIPTLPPGDISFRGQAYAHEYRRRVIPYAVKDMGVLSSGAQESKRVSQRIRTAVQNSSIDQGSVSRLSCRGLCTTTACDSPTCEDPVVVGFQTAQLDLCSLQ